MFRDRVVLSDMSAECAHIYGTYLNLLVCYLRAFPMDRVCAWGLLGLISTVYM